MIDNQSTNRINKWFFIVLAIIVIGVSFFLLINHNQKPATTTTTSNQPTLAPVSASLQLQPNQITPSASGEATIHVLIDSQGAEINGLQFGMKYDPSVMSITTIQPTDFILHHQIMFNINDTKTGMLSYGEFIIPGSALAKGSGTAVDIMVTIKNASAARVSLDPTKALITTPGRTLRATSHNTDLSSVSLSSTGK